MQRLSVLLVFAVTLTWASLSPGWSRPALARGSDAPGGTKLDFDVGDEGQPTEAGPTVRAEREAAKAVRRTGFGVGLCVLALVVVCYWFIFSKAGKPGWAVFIPIYNLIVLLEICGRPLWWALPILLLPCLTPIFAVILAIDLARSFGRGVGFAIGLVLVWIVFLPILAFGSARYRGPAAAV